MKLATKKLFAGLALAMSAVAAHAGGGALTFVDGNAEFTGAYSGPKASFEDIFTLTLPDWADASGSITSTILKSNNIFTKNLDISSFFLSDGVSKYDGVQVSHGANEFWTFEASSLKPGDYTLHIIGTAHGSKGGNYGGQLAMSVVPEPATWGMMLGGMAMVAFLARRRKHSGVSDRATNGAMYAA